MNCKTITHWDGVLHILRNPHGFSEDVIRQARLDAADYIEAHGRRDATPSVSAAPPGKCPMCGTPATFEIRLPDGTAIARQCIDMKVAPRGLRGRDCRRLAKYMADVEANSARIAKALHAESKR